MRSVPSFVAFLIILIARQAGNAQSVRWTTDVPLIDCDGTPCVEAKMSDGSVVRLGIDTGNASSVVDAKTARALGLKPSAPPKPGTPAGMYRSMIPSLSLGGAAYQNLSVVVMDLSAMIAQNRMPHLAGTLAYTAFKDRVLQLDFTARRMRVSEVLQSPAPCADPCDSISLIRFGEQGPPIVVAQGFAINGHAVAAQVDTMFTGSMLIYSSAIAKTGLSTQAKTSQVRTFAYTDGGVQMKQAPADSEMFHNVYFGQGTVYFPTPGVHEPDGLFEATVGLELFTNSVLTLDFHSMKLSLQRSS
jgi:hypothetical protein